MTTQQTHAGTLRNGGSQVDINEKRHSKPSAVSQKRWCTEAEGTKSGLFKRFVLRRRYQWWEEGEKENNK